MRTQGPIRYIAEPAKVAMTTLLAFIAVVFVQVIFIVAANLFRTRPAAPPAPTMDQELSAEEKRIQRINAAQKDFLPDGTLHLITETRALGRYESTPTTPTEVYDVNDTQLWTGLSQDVPYDYLSWTQTARYGDGFPRRSMRDLTHVSPVLYRTLEIPVATADKLLEIWRYDPRSDCFVGYDLGNGKLGYLGANGLTNDQTKVQPFGRFASFLTWWPPEALSPTLLWQTDRRLCQISVDRQQVELIFESPDSDMVDLRISRWDSYRPEGSTAGAQDRPLLDCRTQDGNHYLILKNPDQTIHVTIPDDWNQWMFRNRDFAATERGIFLRLDWVAYPKPATRRDSNWWREYREATKTQWTELYRVDDAGNLDLINRFSWTVPGEQQSVALAGYRDVSARVEPCVKAFSPFLCDLVWTGLLRDRPPSSHNSELWKGFDHFIDEARPGYGVGNWLITAVMLVLTFLHARCRQGSKGMLAFWLVFVALLNVTGFLVYWALNHRPVMKCAACGQRRGLDQANCVRCGAALPTPKHGKLDLIVGL